jgi:hypothetical protein
MLFDSSNEKWRWRGGLVRPPGLLYSNGGAAKVDMMLESGISVVVNTILELDERLMGQGLLSTIRR